MGVEPLAVVVARERLEELEGLVREVGGLGFTVIRGSQ
jgi:hypothetical protein